MGSPGPALRVSGPFPFAAPSLFCSAPSSQLQPQFHPGADPFGRGVRFDGERGHRDRDSFPGVLQSSFCDPQGHRWVTSSDRSLMPQRLGGSLPFPYGDCSDCAPVSPGRGLDGIPGSPGCLPPGSGSSIWGTRSTSFAPSALLSRRLPNCSPVSWLLYRQSCIVMGSTFSGTSTTG